MKKYILILNLLLISVIAFSQTRVGKDKIQLALPKGSVLLSNYSNQAKILSKFNLNVDLEVAIPHGENEYEIDGMQLSIFYHNEPVEKDHLMNMKLGNDGRRKRSSVNNPNYFCEFITINGNRGLLTRDGGQTWGYYSFYLENSDMKSSVSGILNYMNEDEAKQKRKLMKFYLQYSSRDKILCNPNHQLCGVTRKLTVQDFLERSP